MSTQNKNEILGAIAQTMGEIQEVLAKSGYDMSKQDGDNPLAKADDMPPPAEGPEDGAGGEGAPAPEAPAPEMGAEGAPEEGAGHEDPAAALAEQAKSLSDEELDHMLEALMAEKQARTAAPEAGAEGAPAPAEGAAPEAPAEEAAEKSMKSEFASLAKSIGALADGMTKLTSEVAAVKAAQAAKPAPAKVVAKPAAANAANAKVLHKSGEPAKKRLAKSQTMTFLEGELRKRNPLVNSTVIAEANLLKTDSELHEFQDRLSLEGLSFPEGK